MSENVVIKKDRSVTVPASEAKIGIQYDHNVNVITFDCPRYPDDDRNVDLSTMQIYINYMLPDKTLGSYLAENVKVDTNNPDTIHFDWTITRNVTQVKGVLQALVCAKKVDAEGNELYHWNTDLTQSFRVGEGMECLETISSDYADVISQLLVNMGSVMEEFNALSADVTARTSDETLQGLVNNVASDEKLGSIVNAYMEANPIGINVDDTLTVSGDAADAKITGDRISELKSDLANKVNKDGYKEVTAENTRFFEIGKNKFNGVWNQGYMNVNGTVDPSANTYQYTDKIYLEGNYTIVLSALSSDLHTRSGRSARFVTAFDSDGNVLKSAGQENVGSNFTPIVIDESVDSVVMTFTKANPYVDFMIEFGDAPTDVYEPYEIKIQKQYLDVEHNPLYGSTMIAFGDSIMAGDGNGGIGIGDYIAEKYGMTLYDYSLGGATMGVTASNNIYDQVDRAISEVESCDVIILDGLTNDIMNISADTSRIDDPTVPIGDLVSSIYSVANLANTATFSGAFEYSISKLIEKYPNAIILYIRPHQMTSRNITLQELYGERAIDICKRWGIGYVDIYNSYQSRSPAVLRTEFLADYTHPNENGYKKKYLPRIDAELNAMVWKI